MSKFKPRELEVGGLEMLPPHLEVKDGHVVAKDGNGLSAGSSLEKWAAYLAAPERAPIHAAEVLADVGSAKVTVEVIVTHIDGKRVNRMWEPLPESVEA